MKSHTMSETCGSTGKLSTTKVMNSSKKMRPDLTPSTATFKDFRNGPEDQRQLTPLLSTNLLIYLKKNLPPSTPPNMNQPDLKIT